MRLAVAGTVLLLAGCATPGSPRPGGEPIALRNAGFEEPAGPGAKCAPSWGCAGHGGLDSFRFAIDTSSAASGRQSFRIERIGREPWAFVVQGLDGRALRGARLRFSIAARVQGATGPGGGLFIEIDRSSGKYHDKRLVQGSQDWRQLQAEFDVPGDAQVLRVGAILEGPGTLWIDDARLERLAPP